MFHKYLLVFYFRFFRLLPTGVQLVILFCFTFSVVLFDFQAVRQHVGSVESLSLNLLGTFCDAFVLS